MPTCPNGHQSVSDDWCEVCGHRMAAAGAPTGAVPPPPPPPPAYGYPGPGGPVPPPPAPQGPGGFDGPGGYGGPGGFDGPRGYDGQGGYDGQAGPGGHGGQAGHGGHGGQAGHGGHGGQAGHGGPGGYDPNATAQAELCPQCRTPREHMAPFCEECRWNFLTNTATSYTPIAPQPQQGPPPALNLPPGFQSPPPAPQPQHPQPQPSHPDPYEYQGSRPSQVNRPAEPLGADPTHHQAPPQRAPQAPQGFHQAPPPPPAPQQPQPVPPRADDDWMISPPSQQQPPAPMPPAPMPPAPVPPTGPAPQGPPPQFRQPGPPAGWTATIGPDRDYFMAMMQRSGPEATGLNLPAYSPEQHIRLQGNQIGIGRRRHSTGESPDIDLSVPPEDPGVSHQHAVLVQQPDGSWAVVDQNSTNGTTINGSADPIQPYVPVQLQDGDRVHVGAWTTITVRYG